MREKNLMIAIICCFAITVLFLLVIIWEIKKSIDHAKKHNAKLRICEACNVYGSHAHPEGFVAFLDDEVAGTEIEFMQVYSEDELKKYNITGI